MTSWGRNAEKLDQGLSPTFHRNNIRATDLDEAPGATQRPDLVFQSEVSQLYTYSASGD